MTHNLAPWKVETDLANNATAENQRTITEIHDATGETIATMVNCEGVEANANMMAAAPELHVSLSWAVEILSTLSYPSHYQKQCFLQAKAALAKAER